MRITGYTDLHDRHFGKDSNLARLPDECAAAASLVTVFLSIDESFRKTEPSPITPKPKRKR